MSGTGTNTPSIVFVCTGNICRSPMAEVILRHHLEEAGLGDAATVSSCGMGDWHVGNGADRRAVAELRRTGYDGSAHRAAQLGDTHLDADLLIALDSGHVRQLQSAGVPAEKIILLRSFDPAAGDSLDVADPYYGDDSGFATTREQIEAAVPGILDWVRAQKL